MNPRPASSAFYPPDAGSFGQTQFCAETIDFELIRLLQLCGSSAQFTIGLRYGRFDEANGLDETQFVNGST